jgi:hypothetical protein
MLDGFWGQPLGFWLVGVPLLAILVFLWFVIVTGAAFGCAFVMSIWVAVIRDAWVMFRK